MKLVRDVLQAKGYATLEAGTGEDGVRLARRAQARPRPDGHPAAGHQRHRGAASCCARPGDGAHPGGRGHRFGHAAGPRSRSSTPASTRFVGKPINLKEFLETGARRCWSAAAMTMPRPRRRRSSSSTTRRRTSSCSRPPVGAKATRVTAAPTARRRSRSSRRDARPRAARRDDAGAVGLRRVPAHPRRRRDTALLPVVMVTSLDPHAGARQGHRGGRRRFPLQADPPGGAVRARAARCCASRRCRTRCGARPRSSPS